MPLLTLLILLSTLCNLFAEEKNTSWRREPLLEVAYSADLREGRIDGAILKVINWCVTTYQKEIEAKTINKAKAEQLSKDIQEASNALAFVIKHDAKLKKLSVVGKSTFGFYLGCFEELINPGWLRHGKGERFEQFMKSYVHGSEQTQILKRKLK